MTAGDFHVGHSRFSLHWTTAPLAYRGACGQRFASGSTIIEQPTIIGEPTEIMTKSKLLRMDNVGIVVNSLDDTIAFLTELGLKLEGRAMVEGEWAGRITGLDNQRVEIAMMVTPDGHSRLELSRFLTPSVVADHRNAPVNALGYLRAMFTVSDIDETLVRLRKHGAQLVGEVVQYENSYRLCYIRGPEEVLIGLAEPLDSNR
jgi:catechol 2,3-dioxygenase-like lactoylglutathione lyase family enzyme